MNLPERIAELIGNGTDLNFNQVRQITLALKAVRGEMRVQSQSLRMVDLHDAARFLTDAESELDSILRHWEAFERTKHKPINLTGPSAGPSALQL